MKLCLLLLISFAYAGQDPQVTGHMLGKMTVSMGRYCQCSGSEYVDKLLFGYTQALTEVE